MKRRTFLSLMGAAALTSSMMLTGCGAGSDDDLITQLYIQGFITVKIYLQYHMLTFSYDYIIFCSGLICES